MNVIPQPAEGAARLRTLTVLIACALPIQVMGRATITVMVVGAMLCFLSLPEKSRYWRRVAQQARGPLGLMLAVTFILWLPNVFLSIDPQRSLTTAIRPFIYVGVATLFWAVLVEHRWLHNLSLRALLLASLVATTIATIAETGVPELYWFLHFRGWLSVPLGTSLKSYSALAVFMVPVFIWAGFRLRGSWAWLAALNVVGSLAFVWQTYNRAAIAGFVAMAVLAAIWTALSKNSRPVKALLLIGVIALLAGVLIWLNTTRSRPGFQGEWLFPLWLVDFQRQTIWKFALELVERNFWFGLGINTINFAPGADAIIPNTVGNLKMIPSHPHNWLLEVAAETGIFGVLSLVSVVAMSLLRYFRGFLQTGEGAYFVTACVATGYWFSGLFNFSFWSSWWQMSFVLVCAICLAHTSNSAPSTESKTHL